MHKPDTFGRPLDEVLPWDHLDSGLDKDWLWADWVFATPRNRHGFAKLSRVFRNLLLYALAPAA